MYKIERKPFGFKLTFADSIKVEEMQAWADEAKRAVSMKSGKFGVFVDMRELKPLPQEAKVVMESGQKAFKEGGMERSVVILSNTILTMQFKRIAKESGIYLWERYIDASKEPNWEKIGEDWISKGTDPDK